MTLNITVTTRHRIYQSADYRLYDSQKDCWSDFETQKIVLKTTYRWNATVCFTGVGRTREGLNVGEWLAERVGAIQPDDAFACLLEALLEADHWLSNVPPPANRHSFSVGAFVGSEPVFAVVSNFEQRAGSASANASTRLSIFRFQPTKAKTFVSGQRSVVTPSERRRLIKLSRGDPEPERMYNALAQVNRNVAMRTDRVSPGCFTTHVNSTGGGGGCVHDVGNRPFFPTFAIPEDVLKDITPLLDRHFGPGRARLASISDSRAAASEDDHKTRLRKKPNDPNLHSNYGRFLIEKKADAQGAEREYRRAIELEPNHVGALGNLANLLWKLGHTDEAARFYCEALEAQPGDENVTWNYARFLLKELQQRSAVRDVLDRGITKNPRSPRLLLLRAQLSLIDENAPEALALLRRTRGKGAEQAEIEANYAVALQLSGAPISECIAAYRTALAMNPQEGYVKLNLAQLLFIKGEDAEAKRRLQEALSLGLEAAAQLEAQFYQICHTSSHPKCILRQTRSLLAQGARLRWNVRPNIETIRQHDPQKAVLLELVCDVMAGNRGHELLDEALARW